MDYEKKYKEALGWMQSLYNGLHGKTKEEAERYFPELKDEDERIRKWIIGVLSTYEHDGDLRNAAIAWLEKQDKSSSEVHYWTEEEIEPIISDYLRGAEHYGGMIGRLRCLKPKSLEKQGEQKPIDYNEELKKCRENPLYFIDKYVKLKEQKPAWSEEDEAHIHSLLDRLNGMCKKGSTFITTRFAVNQDIDWLKSLRQRIEGE